MGLLWGFFLCLKFKALRVWKSNIHFISHFFVVVVVFAFFFFFLPGINCSWVETAEVKVFLFFDAEAQRVKRLNSRGHRGQTPYGVSGRAPRCFGVKVMTDGRRLLG